MYELGQALKNIKKMKKTSGIDGSPAEVFKEILVRIKIYNIKSYKFKLWQQ